MSQLSFSLQSLGRFWVAIACLVGVISTAVWMHSQNQWEDHQQKAFLAGIALQHSLKNGTALPEGIAVSAFTSEEEQLVNSGGFAAISGLSPPVYITSASLTWQTKTDASPDMRIVIASDDLVYEVSELSSGELSADYDKLGRITRLMASVCSDPKLFVQVQSDQWFKVSGSDVWSCKAAPTDPRLIVILGAFLVLCMLLASVSKVSESFSSFAFALRKRDQIMGEDSYEITGPTELRGTIEAINTYLKTERQKLQNRILLFSGVSHDLGTPAARLRLRAALIKDADLRLKFENDIDQMTSMISGILTLSQSELTTEEPRRVSLTALIEAIVSDFQDMGKRVVFLEGEQGLIEGGSSVFSHRKIRSQIKVERHLVVNARPILLRRAISNLIENALKYGRSATISMASNANYVSVYIEDAGGALQADQLNELIMPFKRGENAYSMSGVGLGLTISSNIATLHGGKLRFDQGKSGIIANFTILRNVI